MERLAPFILIIFLAGCATSPYVDYFTPSQFVVQELPYFEGVAHGELQFLNGQKEFEAFISKQHKMGGGQEMFLGWSLFYGPELTPLHAREIAAELGGDRYSAATAPSGNTFLNTIWIRASADLQRELLSSGVTRYALPQAVVPGANSAPTGRPSRGGDLLLNDSTL
jgi:hypothetical protein